MTDRLRFVLSGPGLIGRQHARLIGERGDSELAAVVAPASDENSRFAHLAGARFYSDLSAALDAERPDAAIISSPNVFHCEQTLACLARGVPVLVEKPMTDRIDEAEQVLSMVERTGVPVLVGHHRTYSPLLDAALDMLRSEHFGRLVALQGSALFYKPAHYFEDGPWRTVKGGGPILINLIHEIGLMRLFGGEIASVQAVAAHNIRRFEVEDTVAISLAFAGGALGTFLLSDTAASSKSWEMTSGENPAYPHFPAEYCYHFAGTNGSLDFPSMAAKAYPTAGGRSWWKAFDEFALTFERRDPLALQLAHFVDVVKNGAAPRVSALDGYRNIQVIEAIRQSIATRSVVDVAVNGPRPANG